MFQTSWPTVAFSLGKLFMAQRASVRSIKNIIKIFKMNDFPKKVKEDMNAVI